MTEFRQLDLHTRLPENESPPAFTPTPAPAPAAAIQNGSDSAVSASPVLPGSRERIAADRLADAAESVLTALAIPAQRNALREAITAYRQAAALKCAKHYQQCAYLGLDRLVHHWHP